VHVSKAEAESLHHQLEEQMEVVTKLKAQIEELEYLKVLAAERGEEVERLTSQLAVVNERETQALRELDLSKRALEAERQQGMTARDSARANDESESANRKRTAKEDMIGKLQSRVVTLESDRTHILRENEAAVYEIGRLSSLLGDQSVEIERLHQVVSDLEAKHKVQMQRVGEASERWRLKRDEAVLSIDSLRAEVEKKDATISKHRRLLEEYQQVTGSPTEGQ
jgi:chromosome segregation ATPase